MIVKNATPIRIMLAKMRARWRVLLGFCPMCNSDAPAVDTCPLCDHFKRTFPRTTPSKERRQKWFNDYDQVLSSMATTRKLVVKAKLNTKENIY